MKQFRILFMAFITTVMAMSCTGQTKKNPTHNKTKSKVEVMYFHYTSRCSTCRAVEQVSKDAVENLFKGKVSFSAYNMDKPDGETKADKLGVSGQTLLIVSGDKKINLTNEAFMNVNTNPEKLKQIIKTKIDSLL